jgi:hypothetical protein
MKRAGRFRLTATGAVVLTLLADAVLAGLAHRDTSDQFWGLTVPGILAGVGTGSLALATAWATSSQRRRDDRMRDQLRADVLVERAATDRHTALMEARRVVLVVHLLGGSPCLRVANASNEPILDIRLLDLRWHLDATGSWDWVEPPVRNARLTQLIGPGQTHDFTGSWVKERPDGTIVTPGSTDLDAAVDGIHGAVQWTDIRGVTWQRGGRAEPVALPTG